MVLHLQVKMSAVYEPKSRIHHFIASVGKKCYMYGGSTPNNEPPSFVEIFDQKMKTWIKQPIELPPSILSLRHTRGSCCALSSGDIYFYGGFIGRKPCDHLYRLKTTGKQLELVKLSPGGGDMPMKKAGCQMVVYHKTRFALYGGATHKSLVATPQQLSRTVPIGGIWSITNELHVFDTRTGSFITGVSASVIVTVVNNDMHFICTIIKIYFLNRSLVLSINERG